MRQWIRACVVGAAVCAPAACSATAPLPSTATMLSLSPGQSPAGAGAMSPQLVATPDGSVLLSWIEPAPNGRKSLRWSRLRDGRWTPAATIVTAADFFANWADVPSMLQLRDGRMAAHWLQKSAASTYAYHVAVSVSTDGGATWGPAITPHGDRSDTEHGFVAMFERADGELGLVWLDGRSMAAVEHGGAHDEALEGQGAMTLRATTIRRDGVAAPDVSIDERVCECCPTAAAVTARGVVVAYRDRGATEVRDIGVARFSGGAWMAPSVVHADGWTIAACPVNGPALSARGDEVALAWFTAEGDRPRVSVAFSRDAGTTFATPVAISEAPAVGRVDLELLDDGSALVAWIEHDPAGSSLRVRRAWPGGRTAPAQTVTPIASGRGSGYPRMVRAGHSLAFAWTVAATPDAPATIRTATAPLPR